MSPRRITRAKLRGEDLENTTCGRLAVENMERAWWQSRHDLQEAPQLADLTVLARGIRATYPTPPERAYAHLFLLRAITGAMARILAPHTTPRLNLNRLELPE